MLGDRYPLGGVREDSLLPLPRNEWPATLAAVRQVLDAGLELGPATVFVGENGSGKSTIIEGIAAAYGMAAEGGSTGSAHSTRPSESPLAASLVLQRNIGSSKRGYFLRAETMHAFFSYLEDNPSSMGDIAFHEMSHGESFLELAIDRFKGHGLWVLDEPESALSFQGCLSLLSHLRGLLATGRSQVLLSTHSPLLAALPGARIYEVGEWGLRETAWEDLPLVRDWSTFLAGPERFLKHL